MLYQREKVLNDFLFFFYALFMFGSAFSIAVAQISFGIALVLFIVLAVIKRYNPFIATLKWFYLFIGCYILWMLIAAVFGDTPLASVLIIKEEWLFCIIPVGVYILQEKAYRKKIITAFAVGVGLFSLYGIVQHFTGFYWPKDMPPHTAYDLGYVVKGTFSHPLTFGNYFGIAAIFFSAYLLTGITELSKKEKIFFSIVSLLTIMAAPFSYSRGAILSLVISLIILSIILGRKQMFYTLGVIVLLVLIVITSFSGLRERIKTSTARELDSSYEGARIYIWKNAFKIIKKNPIFGVGQGNFRNAYAGYLRKDIPDFRKQAHAHNDIINIAAIAGLPGMLFYLGIWIAAINCFWKGLKNIKHFPERRRYFGAAMLGSLMFFMASATEATFADEEVRQLLMFIWAIGLWQWHHLSERTIGA